jgi:hypothetical protein
MAGARCYTDPFVGGGERIERPNPVTRVAAWLGRSLPETIRPPRPSSGNPRSLPHHETMIGPGVRKS